MPRAFDRRIPRDDHNPLRGLLDFTSVDSTVQDAGGAVNAQLELVRQFAEQLVRELLQNILDVALDPGQAIEDLLGQLPDWVAQIPGIAEGAIQDLKDALTGIVNSTPTDLDNWLLSVLTGESQINGEQIVGVIRNALFGVPIDFITQSRPNLQLASSFETAASIADNDDWEWDGTVGWTSLGSAKAVASGVTKFLVGNAIPVEEGQEIDFSAGVKWTSLVWSGSAPLVLGVRAYGASPGDSVIDSHSPSSGSSGGFTELSGTYTVPSGVSEIRQRLILASSASSGTVHYDDAPVLKAQGWLSRILALLADLLNLDEIEDLVGGDRADIWTSVIQNVFNPIGGGVFDPAVIGGHGGFPDLIETWQETWDKFWPGGSGRSLADVANYSTDVAGTATTAAALGDANSTILAVRNNEPNFLGMDPTGQVTFPIVDLSGTPPTFGVTQTASTMGFIRVGKSATLGSIYWLGCGLTSITAAYLTVYRMDAAGDCTKVFETSDVTGYMTAGSTLAWANYDLDNSEKFDVVPGEVIGIELRVQGAGTHTVAGKIMTNIPNHPTQFPKRNGATRNSGTSASPSTIATGSVGYSANVPWFEIGIADGDISPPVFTPRTTSFDTAGAYTYDIPDFILEHGGYIDIIAMGAGEGGSAGSGFSVGFGGNNGNWAFASYQYGVDIPGGTTEITGSVGAGGTPTSFSTGAGNSGGDTTATASGMTTVTATGGSGSSGALPAAYGAGGDNQTYNGVTYIQGAGTSSPGPINGNAPGGGASGGSQASAGGTGAPGRIWFVARTS